MSTEENRKTAISWQNWWTDRTRLAHLADDYTLRNGTSSPFAPTVTGKDEALRHFTELSERPGQLTVDVLDSVAEGDKVALRMVYRVDGTPAANGMVMYRLRDGKIVDDWVCMTALDGVELE